MNWCASSKKHTPPHNPEELGFTQPTPPSRFGLGQADIVSVKRAGGAIDFVLS